MKESGLNVKGLFTALAVTALVILVSFGSLAHAFEPGAATQDQKESLIVRDSRGAFVGTVANALQDQSGKILFVVLSLGEVPGQVSKIVAVPLKDFTYDYKNASLVVNISKEHLSAAPEFDASALDDPQFAERVYQYFGESPAWTE
jgi:hypothetical protein